MLTGDARGIAQNSRETQRPAYASPMRIALGNLAVVTIAHLAGQLAGQAMLADSTQVLLMPALAGVLPAGTTAPRGRLVHLALLPAVALYALAIVVMAVLATGLGRLAGLGAAMFVGSDALIALSAFGVVTLPGHDVWVMSTYIAAQTMLILAVRRRARPTPAPQVAR